jgi:hypothetical protein
MSQPLEYEQVSYNGPDGAQMGKSAATPIAFYGATPIARSDTTYPADLTASTYTTTTNTTVVFGFNSQAAASSLIHQVSSLVQIVKKLGLSA